MKLEAKIDITETEDAVAVNVSGPRMGILIGHRGETLDAVQYLTSLAVNKNTDKYKRITIDTENYRCKREETLTKLAKRLAHKVYKTKRKIVLNTESLSRAFIRLQNHIIFDENEPYRSSPYAETKDLNKNSII